MSNLETLTVEEVILRQRSDGTGEFPVVIIAGISLNISENGNQSFSKRRVSLPVNGLSLQETKSLFPRGMRLEGYRIEQYEVEPYTWTTPEVVHPDTGEIIEAGREITSNVRYRLDKADSPSAAPAPSMESQIFAESSTKEVLQPQ